MLLLVLALVLMLGTHTSEYQYSYLVNYVDLRGTSVSDIGVIALGKHLKRLETVWVSETAVSDFAVTRLLLSLPQVCPH